MRILPSAVSFIVAIIALYFALLWGVEASRILTSPIYGLDDSTFAQTIYGLGRGLSPNGLVMVAAFFGVAKLVVACLFICHIVDRCGGLVGGKVDYESLEAALLLVVIATLVAATPALVDGAPNLLRLHALHLALAGVAAALNGFERIAEREEKTDVAGVETKSVSAWSRNLLRKATSSAVA
jgi:hypothetical protein